ncbi:MAG: tetratricopeptide repeat protein [Planctomycetales bacterium]
MRPSSLPKTTSRAKPAVFPRESDVRVAAADDFLLGDGNANPSAGSSYNPSGRPVGQAYPVPYCRQDYFCRRIPIYHPPIIINAPYGYPTGGVYSAYGPVILPQGGFGLSGFRRNLSLSGFPYQGTASPNVPATHTGIDIPEPGEQQEKLPLVVRHSNPESRARSRKFVGFGDELFRGQNFSLAYQRYQTALQSAPDSADVQFRRGFALTALKQYRRSAAAFHRGLELDRDWPASGFTLTDLYDDNIAAKNGHLERLAAAAEQSPQDADLMFLLGVFLYFDGQPARSRPFFDRAMQLSGDHDDAQAFLDHIPAEPQNAGGVKL